MNGSFVIRDEQESDFNTIRQIVSQAFAGAEHTDGEEHIFIDRLRHTDSYIPELTLVAEIKGNIVGHIMFSKIFIGNREAITLAPLSKSRCRQKIDI